MDAIILAAGFGSRLRPLTETIPKPLIDIRGISLIELHLHNLAQAGFINIIINLHHLGHLIQSKLGDGSNYGVNIHYSLETPCALETAGGIVNALPLIKTDQFIAISADVICDYPLPQLSTALTKNCQGFMVLVDNPTHHPKGDFTISNNGALSTNLDAGALTFSGIACFNKTLFELLEPGKRALRPVLEQAIEAQRLCGSHYQGLWHDVGTLGRLESVRQSSKVRTYIDSIKQSIN